MPNSDTKLLRDELAQAIAENKRHRHVQDEMGQNIIEPTLRIDQLALERDKLELERDQANATVDGLIGILKEITEGKIAIEKILQFYDNPHAPPSNKTITQREIDKGKREE